MGGGGSGSQQVIQKQVNDPPEWMKEFQTDIGGQAKELYDRGIGPGYYPGATYIGPTTQEMAGLQGIQNLAVQGNPLLSGLLKTANNNINLGGLTQGQRNALIPVSEIARSQAGADPYRQATLNSLRPLQSIANTKPGQGNPHLMGLLDTAAGKAKTAMESSFGGMGRDGGAATGIIGREIGDMYTNALAEQYNQDISNIMGASGQMQGVYSNLSSLYDQDIAQKLAAAGQMQGVYGQGQQNALAWAGMAPQLRDMQFDDSRRLIDVGAAMREELQTELQDNIARWNAQQSRPWDQLALYNNIIGGLGGNSGTQTVYGQKGSPIAGLLGGALAGGGLGSSFGGWGGPFGAGLGGLLGLFM